MEKFIDFMFGTRNGFTILVVACFALWIGTATLQWYFQ